MTIAPCPLPALCGPLERVLPTRVGLGAGLGARLIDEIHLQYPFYGSRRFGSTENVFSG